MRWSASPGRGEATARTGREDGWEGRAHRLRGAAARRARPARRAAEGLGVLQKENLDGFPPSTTCSQPTAVKRRGSQPRRSLPPSVSRASVRPSGSGAGTRAEGGEAEPAHVSGREGVRM